MGRFLKLLVLRLISLLFLLQLPTLNAFADVPPGQVAEVEHLIKFIRSADCRLERNDEFYTDEEVIEHILKKYDYYREEINSTEKFIELSASKSVISGKPYIAHCNNSEPVNARIWLLKELRSYRESVKLK